MAPARRRIFPSKIERPGPRFLCEFLREFYKQNSVVLRVRRPRSKESERFQAVKSEVMTAHFAVLEKSIQEQNIDAAHILNLAEAGASPERDVRNKCTTRRFMPPHRCQDEQVPNILHKNRINLITVISAAGPRAPPPFVLNSSAIPYRVSLRDGIRVAESPASYLPANPVFAMRTENEGVSSTRFLNWAAIFVRYTASIRTSNRDFLLVYDGYKSHLSLLVLKLFNQNGIVVYSLPAHTSGQTRPLDNFVFSSFKASIAKTLQTGLLAAPECSFSQYDFCDVLSSAHRTAISRSTFRQVLGG